MYIHVNKHMEEIFQLLIPAYLEAVCIHSSNNVKNLPCSRASVLLIYELG